MMRSRNRLAANLHGLREYNVVSPGFPDVCHYVTIPLL